MVQREGGWSPSEKEGGRLAWHECTWREGCVGRYQRRGANCESLYYPMHARERERESAGGGEEGGKNEGWIEEKGRLEG